jgi:sulfate transport system ATP-binding protein
MSILVRNVSKNYKEFKALDDVSLDIEDGELIALLGPSGSGKTTLLRMIAGLDQPDSGTILVKGKTAQQAELKDRNVGFVFQHYALFRHMTVFENVAFGLRVRKREDRLPEPVLYEKVMELLTMVHLDAFHDRYPSQLSGGQRQRVALARALAVEPGVLLLDEPFGALDAKVRKELRRWMRRLHDDLNITSIFVTHDQEEAMEMADRVIVMSQGHIEQAGTPEEVYLTPKNAFVYDFLGHYNEFIAWQKEDGTLELEEDAVVETARETAGDESATSAEGNAENDVDNAAKNSAITLTTTPPKTRGLPMFGRVLKGFYRLKQEAAQKKRILKKSKTYEGKRVKVFCRPHELFIETKKEDGMVSAQIIHINPAGPLVKLELERINGHLLDAEISKTAFDSLALEKGQEVFVKPKEVKIFT